MVGGLSGAIRPGHDGAGHESRHGESQPCGGAGRDLHSAWKGSVGIQIQIVGLDCLNLGQNGDDSRNEGRGIDLIWAGKVHELPLDDLVTFLRHYEVVNTTCSQEQESASFIFSSEQKVEAVETVTDAALVSSARRKTRCSAGVDAGFYADIGQKQNSNQHQHIPIPPVRVTTKRKSPARHRVGRGKQRTHNFCGSVAVIVGGVSARKARKGGDGEMFEAITPAIPNPTADILMGGVEKHGIHDRQSKVDNSAAQIEDACADQHQTTGESEILESSLSQYEYHQSHLFEARHETVEVEEAGEHHTVAIGHEEDRADVGGPQTILPGTTAAASLPSKHDHSSGAARHKNHSKDDSTASTRPQQSPLTAGSVTTPRDLSSQQNDTHVNHFEQRRKTYLDYGAKLEILSGEEVVSPETLLNTAAVKQLTDRWPGVIMWVLLLWLASVITKQFMRAEVDWPNPACRKYKIAISPVWAACLPSFILSVWMFFTLHNINAYLYRKGVRTFDSLFIWFSCFRVMMADVQNLTSCGMSSDIRVIAACLDTCVPLTIAGIVIPGCDAIRLPRKVKRNAIAIFFGTCLFYAVNTRRSSMGMNEEEEYELDLLSVMSPRRQKAAGYAGLSLISGKFLLATIVGKDFILLKADYHLVY